MNASDASSANPTPIRALIVDDEALARRGIRQLLASHPDVEVGGECRNGAEALETLAAARPDVMFLDVQMPEVDGFAVMHSAIEARGVEQLPVTVFLTAYEEFALGAFAVEATDYLVKPVAQARFDATMERVRRRLATRTTATHEVATPAQHLFVPGTRGHHVVALDDVDWIGADDYYAAIHANGRRHLLRETMASLEKRLDPATFVRIHRQAIVNIGRVREIRSSGGDAEVVLRDGTRLPVSRRRRAELLRAMR